jgi:hypothetical protein
MLFLENTMKRIEGVIVALGTAFPTLTLIDASISPSDA